MSYRSKREEIVSLRNLYSEYLALKASPRPPPEAQSRSATIRADINRAVPIVISNLRSVGEPTTIYYSPAPMVGGVSGTFDLLQNLFNPALRGIEQNVFDMLDRGIGRYDYFIKNEWKKWINPFYWLGELIRIPFTLIRFSGFDSTTIELSVFGKLYKLVAGFLAFIVTLIKIYEFLKPWLITKGLVAN